MGEQERDAWESGHFAMEPRDNQDTATMARATWDMAITKGTTLGIQQTKSKGQQHVYRPHVFFVHSNFEAKSNVYQNAPCDGVGRKGATGSLAKCFSFHLVNESLTKRSAG